MSIGHSIRLFLVDGVPTGLLTAEIMNWTGHVLTGPRSKISELIQRPECGRTGIYFLVRQNSDNSLKPLVYIGETDDVSTRLKQHNRPEAQGGKDFWDKVCLVTSKDQNLTKAHVKYLEAALIKNAQEMGRCKLINGAAHDYGNLPEPDQADMAFFHNQIRTILPVLGFNFLRAEPVISPDRHDKTAAGPVFQLTLPKHGIKAQARELDGEFVVLKGSLARHTWCGADCSYKALFDQLCADKVLMPTDDGQRRFFTTDYAFTKPSAAAAVVSGRSANGRTAWRVADSGDTYAVWQDRQVSAVKPRAQ